MTYDQLKRLRQASKTHPNKEIRNTSKLAIEMEEQKIDNSFIGFEKPLEDEELIDLYFNNQTLITDVFFSNIT